MSEFGEMKHILRLAQKRTRVSVFWITENQERARAMVKLQKSGAVQIIKEGYPWSILQKDGET